MPGNFQLRGYAEAFPLAKLAASGAPCSGDSALAEQARSIGTAGNGASFGGDIDVDRCAVSVAKVVNSQRQRAQSVPLQCLVVQQDRRTEHNRGSVALQFPPIGFWSYDFPYRHDPCQLDGEATVTIS